MDRLIAEKVMGWHARGFDGKWHDWYDGYEFVIGWSRWHPSSCIFQAWQVVERLRDLGHFLNVCQRQTVCWAEIETYDGDLIDRFKADTAPLAICLAALRAVGEGEG